MQNKEALHEDVSQNPERPHRRRDVHAHESRQADGLSHAGDLHDVVGALQRELLSANGEVDVRQAGDLGAVDHVLAASDGRASN